jgi:hypothetical protein
VESDSPDPRQPAAHFQRRALLYADLDRELSRKTRFFGAASMTNNVLGRLFEFHPTLISPDSGRLLQRLGAALERLNVGFAKSIRAGVECGDALDRRLVEAEQRAAQTQWGKSYSKPVEQELDDLLNGSHVLCLFARFWKDSRDYSAVLAALRRQMGVRLNFADEAHRVNIGCALIAHLHTARHVARRIDNPEVPNHAHPSQAEKDHVERPAKSPLETGSPRQAH